MKFKLEIDLGNDAMLTCADIAGALYSVADKMSELGDVVPPEELRPIRDENGNIVGRWGVR